MSQIYERHRETHEQQVQQSDEGEQEEELMVSERRVICFADKSNQKFDDHNGFERHLSYHLI